MSPPNLPPLPFLLPIRQGVPPPPHPPSQTGLLGGADEYVSTAGLQAAFAACTAGQESLSGGSREITDWMVSVTAEVADDKHQITLSRQQLLSLFGKLNQVVQESEAAKRETVRLERENAHVSCFLRYGDYASALTSSLSYGDNAAKLLRGSASRIHSKMEKEDARLACPGAKPDSELYKIVDQEILRLPPTSAKVDRDLVKFAYRVYGKRNRLGHPSGVEDYKKVGPWAKLAQQCQDDLDNLESRISADEQQHTDQYRRLILYYRDSYVQYNRATGTWEASTAGIAGFSKEPLYVHLRDATMPTARAAFHQGIFRLNDHSSASFDDGSSANSGPRRLSDPIMQPKALKRGADGDLPDDANARPRKSRKLQDPENAVLKVVIDEETGEVATDDEAILEFLRLFEQWRQSHAQKKAANTFKTWLGVLRKETNSKLSNYLMTKGGSGK